MKYSFIRLLQNIKYLMTVKLNEEFPNQSYKNMLYFEDYCKYELPELERPQLPKILDYKDSLELILNKPKSFCRLGDGEIDLIIGRSIPFQEYDERLAKIMSQILNDDDSDLYIGLNHNYFHSTKHYNDFNRKFYFTKTSFYRDYILRNCSYKREYIDAGFNQLYMVTKDMDYEAYFKELKKLFAGRDIVLYAGKGIVPSFKHNLFEMAKSMQIIEGPIKDSFREYDVIKNKVRENGKDKTHCFILGPTSKALVYELSKEGYLCWDIGHMAKDYNFYMNEDSKSDKSITDFYQPD